MLSALRLGPLVGLVAMLTLTGCDLYIPIFHEDPTTLSDDRTDEAKQLDDRIRGDILSAFVGQEVGTLKNVTVDVYEGNVLLTGTVTSPEARNTAQTVAAETDEIGNIFNEIQVVKDASLRDKTEDLSIETRLKTTLRKSTKINSFNLRWRVVNRNVYIFGRAKTPEEREKALEITRSIKGINEVVDHIEVRAPTGVQSWLDNLL
ncbi:MAG: BON domain-containing protein [Alphaproteobacteria bacterium]|nr:BON domain-containing protein [Alphaproteobacteria bacterium]